MAPHHGGMFFKRILDWIHSSQGCLELVVLGWKPDFNPSLIHKTLTDIHEDDYGFSFKNLFLLHPFENQSNARLIYSLIF